MDHLRIFLLSLATLTALAAFALCGLSLWLACNRCFRGRTSKDLDLENGLGTTGRRPRPPPSLPSHFIRMKGKASLKTAAVKKHFLRKGLKVSTKEATSLSNRRNDRAMIRSKTKRSTVFEKPATGFRLWETTKGERIVTAEMVTGIHCKRPASSSDWRCRGPFQGWAVFTPEGHFMAGETLPWKRSKLAKIRYYF